MLEQSPPAPAGPGEHFSGYAVMGLAFDSGHVLAFRRFPSTPDGSAYTAVWHRSPDGRWTFYSDVQKDKGCSRYWGPLIEQTIVAPIRIEWPQRRTLVVSVDSGRAIGWSMAIEDTALTGALTRFARVIPSAWWHRRLVSLAVGAAAGALLGTGRLILQAPTPTGHEFTTVPHTLALVAASRATVNGLDIGQPTSIGPRATLGAFMVPRRGLFAAGTVTMRVDA